MMTAAVCFDGIDDEALVEAARAFLPTFATIEAWCGHSHEAGRLLEDILERHHAPPPPMNHATIDVAQAQAIASHGAELLRQAGYDAVTRTFEGRDAGHAIAAASHAGILLIILVGHREDTGPKSVGHVARFIIDHANSPVLLLRTTPHSR